MGPSHLEGPQSSWWSILGRWAVHPWCKARMLSHDSPALPLIKGQAQFQIIQIGIFTKMLLPHINQDRKPLCCVFRVFSGVTMTPFQSRSADPSSKWLFDVHTKKHGPHSNRCENTFNPGLFSSDVGFHHSDSSPRQAPKSLGSF